MQTSRIVLGLLSPSNKCISVWLWYQSRGREWTSNIPSHIRHGMDYFKSPADIKEQNQLHIVASCIPRALPTIKVQPVQVGDSIFLKYRGIPYGPLTHTEARSCLYDLVPKLVQVMESIHQNGWAHQDIRLQNICFDEECRPVFIDLDRCRPSTGVAFYSSFFCSFYCSLY